MYKRTPNCHGDGGGTFFFNFGIPVDIVLDRGPQFISRVWRSFLSLLGVTVSLSSGYHPQSNGQMERKIQEIGRYLRTFCHSHQNSWNRFIALAEYAQNSLRQPTTNLKDQPQSSSVQQTLPKSSSVQQTLPQSSSSVQQTLPQSPAILPK